MSGNGQRRPPRPRIEIAAASASEEESAAIAAAIERFLEETAPAPEAVEPVSPWQRAALIEGVERQAAGLPGGPGSGFPVVRPALIGLGSGRVSAAPVDRLAPIGRGDRTGTSSNPTQGGDVAVVKIIELVGSSKTSTDDAAKQALNQASGSLRNIRAVDIVSTGIRGENLDEYRAHVRVAFLIEGSDVD